MEREEFEVLSLSKKVDYVNEQMAAGKTMADVAQELSIPRTTLSTWFSRGGYRNVGGQYVQKEPEANLTFAASSTEPETRIPSLLEERVSALEEAVSKLLAMYDMDMTNSIHARLEELEGRKMERIEQIQITNLEEGKAVRTTIRANAAVWERWQQFCDSHREHTRISLLNQALLEFMEQHR